MMHCFVTPWTAVVTFSARPAAAGLRCAPPLLLARRPQGRSRNFTTAWPQRELLRSPGGVPEIARVFPEQYESLLNEKVELLESLLADAVTHHDEDESLPPIEVFRSPSINFRMRASFQVWRDGVDPDATRHFVMYNRDDKVMPREVLSYPMGSLRINALMAPTLEAISASEVLQRKVRDVSFLTTLSGEALISISYNTPIGDEWVEEATPLAAALDARIVGRSRGVKLVVGGETVSETLEVPGRGACTYTQTEGAFTQPNAKVCEQMLGWAFDATRGFEESDLCELYCGNGCFTIALAPNFRRVVATELSKSSVHLAEGNVAANGVTNVQVARLSAEEFVEAHARRRHFRRLETAGIDLGEAGGYQLETLFVDPPRAGLDAASRGLAASFERVVYISCNPETLARDVRALSATHDVARVAAFDQFPYTPHLECGVVLQAKSDRYAAGVDRPEYGRE